MVDARGRTPISKRLFVDILSRQVEGSVNLPAGVRKEREMKLWAIGTYGGIPCARCGKRMLDTKECVRDHIILRRLAPNQDYRAFDTADNQQYICVDCHHEKTYKRGRLGLGSDASRAAKLRRVEKKGATADVDATSQRRDKGARKRKKSAKIPSRPFPKMDGRRIKMVSGKRKMPSRPFPKPAREQA